MGERAVHHRTNTHTLVGKGFKKKKKSPDVDLFLQLCFIYYIPPPPPTLLLACILSFVIVRQTQIHQNDEFPPPFSPVGRVIFSVCFILGFGHWSLGKDAFQEKCFYFKLFFSPFSLLSSLSFFFSSYFTIISLIDTMLPCMRRSRGSSLQSSY